MSGPQTIETGHAPIRAWVEGVPVEEAARRQLFNIAAHLVFSASGRDVRDVWVDGNRIVADGEPQTFDVAHVRAEAQAAAEELFERRAKVLADG